MMLLRNNAVLATHPCRTNARATTPIGPDACA